MLLWLVQDTVPPPSAGQPAVMSPYAVTGGPSGRTPRMLLDSEALGMQKYRIRTELPEDLDVCPPLLLQGPSASSQVHQPCWSPLQPHLV